MIKTVNILILGGSGFLGSHLLKKIISNKTYKIFCYVRNKSNFNKFNLKENNLKKIFFITEKNLEKTFVNFQFDIICNCAVQYGRKGPKDTKKVIYANITFPIRILELAVKYKSKCFINTDSYFTKNNNTYKSLLNYSLSKSSLALWLKAYSNQIKIVNIILEHLYGDPLVNDKFLEKCIYGISIKKAKSIDLTPGKQKRDFIYIDDVVTAYLKIIKYSLKNSFSYNEINLGTGKSYSIEYFLNLIKKTTNSPTVLHFGIKKYRSDEIFNSYANFNKLKKYKIRFINNIESGILKTYKKMKFIYE